MRCRGCGFPHAPCDLEDKQGEGSESSGVCAHCMMLERNQYRSAAVELAQIVEALMEHIEGGDDAERN